MPKRKNRTRVLVAGSVAAALGLAGTIYGIAGAAEQEVAEQGAVGAATGDAVLTLRAANKNVKAARIKREDGVQDVSFDLGVNLIAGKQPFELRVKRKDDYSGPLDVQQIVTGSGGRKTTVKVPDGMVTDFGGLKDFTKITFKDGAGATVKEFNTDWCPNSYKTNRTRKDAPASSPYPNHCTNGNPFWLGGVWGVQAGYNSPMANRPTVKGDPLSGEEERSPVDLPAGDYQVTVQLNANYKAWLKVPDENATLSLTMNVVEGDANPSGAPDGLNRVVDGTEPGELSEAEARNRAVDGTDAAEGQESAQVSETHPELRAPARPPRALGSAPKSGPRPDLRSLPAWGISLKPEEEAPGKTLLSFGATVWNAGTSPLMVDGFRETDADKMDAYQYFYDARGKEVGSVQAGTMEWDPREGHSHWHFTDFAEYNLLGADQKKIEKSGKEAFCLTNTDAVDLTIPNAKMKPDNTDLSSSCGSENAISVREVLDIGGGDTYTQSRPGQSFDVTDLPNGTYYIQTVANPQKKLAELKTDNNSSLRQIILGGTPEKRTLEVPAVNGIVG